jgi:hypothetical protein
MKSLWQRLRLFWWTRICGFPPEAAADLMEGADLGDRPMLRFGGRRIGGRRWPHPPACPGLPTVEEIERMDAEFRANSAMQKKVVDRILNDLRREDEARRTAANYLAGRN